MGGKVSTPVAVALIVVVLVIVVVFGFRTLRSPQQNVTPEQQKQMMMHMKK